MLSARINLDIFAADLADRRLSPEWWVKASKGVRRSP